MQKLIECGVTFLQEPGLALENFFSFLLWAQPTMSLEVLIKGQTQVSIGIQRLIWKMGIF